MNDHEQEVEALTLRMRDLGAEDPGSWAESEAREGIPQQARYLLLRRIWAQALTPWRNPPVFRQNQALARLVDQGAEAELLAEALRRVVFDTVSALVMTIDEGHDPDAPDDAPGWTLMEADNGGRVTGRHVGGLHESLLEVDPTGTEAADFW